MAAAERVPSEDGYLLVAAIDFGTTYSGYAYSFVSQDENSIHEEIRINKGWQILEYQVRLRKLCMVYNNNTEPSLRLHF